MNFLRESAPKEHVISMLQRNLDPHFGNRTKCDFQVPGSPLLMLRWPVSLCPSPRFRPSMLALVRLSALAKHPAVILTAPPSSSAEAGPQQ